MCGLARSRRARPAARARGGRAHARRARAPRPRRPRRVRRRGRLPRPSAPRDPRPLRRRARSRCATASCSSCTTARSTTTSSCARSCARRAIAFSTGTDSEVILAAYREWGEACVERFNGMWAFVIWDASRRTLFCSRDRLGIKPFYYRVDGTRFAFASEPWPLARGRREPRRRPRLPRAGLPRPGRRDVLRGRRPPAAGALAHVRAGRPAAPAVLVARAARRRPPMRSRRCARRSSTRCACSCAATSRSARACRAASTRRRSRSPSRTTGHEHQKTVTAYFDDARLRRAPVRAARSSTARARSRTGSRSTRATSSNDLPAIVAGAGRAVRLDLDLRRLVRHARGAPRRADGHARRPGRRRDPRRLPRLLRLPALRPPARGTARRGDARAARVRVRQRPPLGRGRARDPARARARSASRRADSCAAVRRSSRPSCARRAAPLERRTAPSSPTGCAASCTSRSRTAACPSCCATRTATRWRTRSRRACRCSTTGSSSSRSRSRATSSSVAARRSRSCAARSPTSCRPTVAARRDKLGFVTPESALPARRARRPRGRRVRVAVVPRARASSTRAPAAQRLQRHRSGDLQAGMELWRALNLELWARRFLDS